MSAEPLRQFRPRQPSVTPAISAERTAELERRDRRIRQLDPDCGEVNVPWSRDDGDASLIVYFSPDREIRAWRLVDINGRVPDAWQRIALEDEFELLLQDRGSLWRSVIDRAPPCRDHAES